MTFLADMDGETGFLPAHIGREKGADLHAQYQDAQPFPHIVIDDFLPAGILETCLREFPKDVGSEGIAYDRAQERAKFQFMPDTLEPNLRSIFYAFNSLPFIRVLENITGIKGLVPDPYFFGAGFHEIRQGGHLSIHADFNHHKPMNLERRINVLIYLNKDWKDEYGGQLELWDTKMTRCFQSILPTFNRCVIFNTTGESNHGNPHPINHPDGISRKSIALYYYTATWNAANRDYTTQFRPRPGSGDKPDWQVKARELLVDLAPPLLYRALRRSKKG